MHTHPGSEAFYLLAGAQTVRTPSGLIRTAAGQGGVGPAPGVPLQVVSTDSVNRDALAMFVLDATQPTQSPATFPAGVPVALSRTGRGAGRQLTPAAVMGVLAGAVAGAVMLARALARRRCG